MSERGEFKTTYGAPMPPYEAAGPAHDAVVERLGYPGEPPFTRGVQPTMYRGRLWTMRQYAGFGTAEESNARYRYLLSQGQTGLSVAFDLPTQMGFDADDPRAEGEVGKVGVSISSIDDFALLLADIPLDRVTTSMTINATAAILLAMYVAVARRQGVPLERIGGTTQNDILKEYIARGTYIFPPRPSMRLVTDVFAYCAEHLPRWNTISISGYHIREAGADAVQELAFTFANAIAYVQAAVDGGLAVDRFAGQLSFFFAANATLIEEVAKFRAARRIWERIMRERFGSSAPASLALRFHTQTMGSTLTAQQPLNNVIRTATEALSAVLGGTQSLHTNSYDEALALPTEEAVRIALRTQQVIAHETGVANTIDPLGGSYFVEALTDRMESAAYEYFGKIDELGGMIEAIKQNYPQREIADASFRHQQEVDRGERIVVGVNRYADRGDEPISILRIDPGLERKQIGRLQSARARRSGEDVDRTLGVLREAAATEANLMEPIIDCARAGATEGEIVESLQRVFGTYSETPVF